VPALLEMGFDFTAPFGFTESRSSFDGLKNGTRLAGTSTLAPVLVYEIGFGHGVGSFRAVGGLSGASKNSFFSLIIDGMKTNKKAIDVEV
jgi:hypothetical protein